LDTPSFVRALHFVLRPVQQKEKKKVIPGIYCIFLISFTGCFAFVKEEMLHDSNVYVLPAVLLKCDHF